MPTPVGYDGNGILGRTHQHEHAVIEGGSIGRAGGARAEFGIVARVAFLAISFLACEIRGMNAWLAAQRRHAETRIVRERG